MSLLRWMYTINAKYLMIQIDFCKQFVHFQGRRTNMLEHYDGSMQTSAISWQYVMSAYDAINCNLHE